MGNMTIFYFNFCQLLRYPYLVLSHWYFSKYFSRYVKYYFLKKLKIDKNSLINSFYSSGTYKFVTLSHFYKIGTRFGPLNTEKNNIQLIRTYFPSLMPYVGVYKIHYHGVLCSLSMPTYIVPTQSEALKAGIEILQKLRTFSSKGRGEVREFPYLKHGLYLTKVLYKNLELECKVRKALSLTWSIGLVHGDLHLGNVLIDDNHPIVIDLDNVSQTGIQALDAFTFWLDYKIKQTHLSWQEVLKLVINDEMCEAGAFIKNNLFDNDVKSLALLYVLNRLGYENKHYRLLSRSVQREYSVLQELGEKKED